MTHPQIEEIVEMIAKNGQKPVINTNGQLLTIEKLKALKNAGVVGFTFHIDSGQRRPHLKDKNEIELNNLRHHYASMLADVGDISCAFNATVYGHTLKYVPNIIEWGQKNIDIVHSLVFIAYRAAPIEKGYDYFVGADKVDLAPITYAMKDDNEISIMSTDIVRVIRERFPEFQPSAYLNGTERPDHFKWLLSLRLGTKDRIYGYAGPKFMELSQAYHHFAKGSYLAYMRPKVYRKGKSMLLLSPLDKGLKGVASNFLKHSISVPITLLKKLHIQSIMIIQPVDFMKSGAFSMCDGCPDMTIFDDRLVWSCRLEELYNYGEFVRGVPRDDKNSRPPLPQQESLL